MKPPVLRVTKGAEVYDDSRGRELTAAFAVQEAAPPARRRRGRRLGIAFLPLLVGAIVIAIAFQLAARRDIGSFAGWTARLEAAPSGGVLDVSVTFARRAGVPARTALAGASIRILLPETGATADVFGALTPPYTTLHGQLTLLPSVRSARADVTIGAESRSLVVSIRSRR